MLWPILALLAWKRTTTTTTCLSPVGHSCSVRATHVLHKCHTSVAHVLHNCHTCVTQMSHCRPRLLQFSRC
jgi:hypothetical protein